MHSPIAAAAREVIMPTVKQLAVIAIAIAAAIVGAGTVGISAIEHSATQEHSVTRVLANRSRLQRLISGSMILSGSERSFWAKNTLSCP